MFSAWLRLASLSLAASAEPWPTPPLAIDLAHSFSAETRRSAPRSYDPWTLLRDVPGVVLDRVDVAGSETGQQSLVVSKGDPGAGTSWFLDGVEIGDPVALGFLALFPDMDAVDSVRIRTSTTDARVRTPGAQVELMLPEPPENLSGSLHLRETPRFLGSDELPGALRDRPFPRTRARNLLEYGGSLGGPIGERVRVFGAASRQELDQDLFTGHADGIVLTSFLGKATLRAGSGSLSALAVRSEKLDDDRDGTASAAPEARWRQTGGAWLLSIADRRAFGAWTLRSQLSRLDSGFRLEPQGDGVPFEDFRGVFQGSFFRFETDRPRWSASLEAARAFRGLGFEHAGALGLEHSRSEVLTESAWPGSGAIGFERDTVFFRTFRLTGFAQLTRDQRVRTRQGRTTLFLEDTARRGRLALHAGLRLDRSSGRALASSASANGLRPDLLPGLAFPRGAGSIRWRDVLPRAAVAWQASSDGALVARLSYSAYAAALGPGEIGFDDPLREVATLSYFWLDRDADHRVDPDEVLTSRGLAGSSGLDPALPGAASSPHAIDAELRSPRTRELTASLEQRLGESWTASFRVVLRRLDDPLWRPLRNLTSADYAVTGSAVGTLFGRDYALGAFAPVNVSKLVPGNGRELRNRAGYLQDGFSVELAAAGRFASSGHVRAWGALLDTRERFGDRALAVQDPTPLDVEPLHDNGRVALRPGGLGRGDLFVNARFMAGFEAGVTLPGRLDVAALFRIRDGFPIPYFEVASTGDTTGGDKNVLVSERLDEFRLPTLALLDAGVARRFELRHGSVTARIDAFNLLGAATALQAARDAELPSVGRTREIVRGRTLRLGIEWRF